MTLKNKLGITDSAELARTEEKISKKKAVELFVYGLLDKLEAGKFSALAEIHKYLFDEIFGFAGIVRDVNIAKSNFRFAPVMYLNASLIHIDTMPQSTFDEIVEKYVEMNVAHPFREGNGRSTRIGISGAMVFLNNLFPPTQLSKCFLSIVINFLLYKYYLISI
ncbi:MAG: Fic family protein [bacterium]